MRRIGISYGLSLHSKYAVHKGYPEAIVALGGLPLMFASASAIPTMSEEPELSLESLAKEMVGSVDALLVTGGWDVEPHFYGQEPGEELEATEPVRDHFEAALIKESLSQGKKVLAVCRGIQILNVTLGGTLYQDLVAAGFSEHSDEAREYEVSHNVVFQRGSVLAELMEGATGVNTLHHQGIDELGEGLRAVAHAPDGVVEAVEGEGIVGIQWHPERLFARDTRHLAGFRWLMA